MRKVNILIATVAAVIIGGLVGLIIAAANASEQDAFGEVSSTKIVKPPTSNEVEAELNKFRAERGLPALYTDSAILDKAAQIRAESMCADNDWSHNKAWEVLDKHYDYAFASENLYFNSLQEGQATHSIKEWSESPGHLGSMLKDHKEIGVGVKYCPGFQGNQTAVIITNYFGVPR